MQIKKETVRQKIKDAAMDAFLELGYEKASLRNIAQRAFLTKGAIYSYFDSKNGLFLNVVHPAVHQVETGFSTSDCHPKEKKLNILGHPFVRSIEDFQNCAHSVLKYHNEFKLLFFRSGGSSLENYRETVINIYTENFKKALIFFTQSTDICLKSINKMLIHTLGATYAQFLEEIILNEPNREQIDMYAEQMAIFVESGFRGLYNHVSPSSNNF